MTGDNAEIPVGSRQDSQEPELLGEWANWATVEELDKMGIMPPMINPKIVGYDVEKLRKLLEARRVYLKALVEVVLNQQWEE